MSSRFLDFQYRDKSLREVRVQAQASELDFVIEFARRDQKFMVKVKTDLQLSICKNDLGFQSVASNIAKWMILNGTYVQYADIRNLSEVNFVKRKHLVG
ncbi:MAG: hypothetical protein IPG71_02145 [bacterium]|nr:hypothetical protein [bacterium]